MLDLLVRRYSNPQIAEAQTVYVGSTLIHHMWRTNVVPARGDSGGPTLVADTGEGVFSSYDSINNHSWYTIVGRIVSEAGVRLCLDALCN